MYRDCLVTLDNDFQLLVLEEADINGRKFILGVPFDEQSDDIDTSDFILKEVINENGDDRFVAIEDQEEAVSVGKILTTKFADR